MDAIEAAFRAGWEAGAARECWLAREAVKGALAPLSEDACSVLVAALHVLGLEHLIEEDAAPDHGGVDPGSGTSAGEAWEQYAAHVAGRAP